MWSRSSGVAVAVAITSTRSVPVTNPPARRRESGGPSSSSPAGTSPSIPSAGRCDPDPSVGRGRGASQGTIVFGPGPDGPPCEVASVTLPRPPFNTRRTAIHPRPKPGVTSPRLDGFDDSRLSGVAVRARSPRVPAVVAAIPTSPRDATAGHPAMASPHRAHDANPGRFDLWHPHIGLWIEQQESIPIPIPIPPLRDPSPYLIGDAGSGSTFLSVPPIAEPAAHSTVPEPSSLIPLSVAMLATWLLLPLMRRLGGVSRDHSRNLSSGPRRGSMLTPRDVAVPGESSSTGGRR